MGIFEDVRRMATELSAFPSQPVQARVSLRSLNRLRSIAQNYGLSEVEACTALLSLMLDHDEHVKIMALDTSTATTLFSEELVDSVAVLLDLLKRGFEIHLSSSTGYAYGFTGYAYGFNAPGGTFRASVEVETGVSIDSSASSLAAAIRGLPGEIAKEWNEDEG